ncbi:MAG TPA: lipid II flippase MurJ, partial [Stellaceae bacterium]|nr:lipid II flippase MurJ [Stellaceae bacterium]
AAALSAAGWLQAVLLMTLLARRGHFHFDARSRASLPRIAAATIGMGAALLALRLALEPAFAGSTALRLAALAGLVAAGLIAFLALILLLGVVKWRELRRLPA